MEIALRVVVFAIFIRGAVAGYGDSVRGARRAASTVRSLVTRAANALIRDWRAWRSYRHRMAVRRRESKERLLVEGQRELVGMIASQYEEIARLRARLEPSPDHALHMPAQRRPFTPGS